jgi:glycosyltransferase involved in cell wall biosynthesis
MRVIVTIPWGRRLGGAEAMLQTVFDGALQTEHELEPVFLQDGPWASELARAGYRVEVLDAGRLREARRYLATVAALARIFRRRDPAIILNWSAKTHLYGSPAATVVGMAGRVCWWQHDIPARRGIDVAATLLPARAIGCTSASAAAAQGRLFPKRPTFVVHAGSPRVDAHRTAPPPLSLPDGVPVVGIVGRLQPWKGQDRLLRAQALLRERGHAMHAVIVGGDSYGLSPAYARSLPALAAELGLSHDVTLTGEVPDAGPYIEQMDILVNASDPEPFGIVLLEGLARGVAVVAVDTGGPRELIEHQRTGMLASSGEPHALADAIEPLLASSELRHTIGVAGRARFERDLTEEAMRERFFSELTRLRASERR